MTIQEFLLHASATSLHRCNLSLYYTIEHQRWLILYHWISKMISFRCPTFECRIFSCRGRSWRKCGGCVLHKIWDLRALSAKNLCEAQNRPQIGCIDAAQTAISTFLLRSALFAPGPAVLASDVLVSLSGAFESVEWTTWCNDQIIKVMVKLLIAKAKLVKVIQHFIQRPQVCQIYILNRSLTLYSFFCDTSDSPKKSYQSPPVAIV